MGDVLLRAISNWWILPTAEAWVPLGFSVPSACSSCSGQRDGNVRPFTTWNTSTGHAGWLQASLGSSCLCWNLIIMIWSPILPKHRLPFLCELPGSAATTGLERLRAARRMEGAGWTVGAGRARPARVFVARGLVQRGGQIIHIWGLVFLIPSQQKNKHQAKDAS